MAFFFFFSPSFPLIFSAENHCFSSSEMEEKKPKSTRSKEKPGKDSKKKTPLKWCESISDSGEDEDADSAGEGQKWLKAQSSPSTLLPWTTDAPEAASSPSSVRKSTSSSSAAQVLSCFASGTSIAKKQAAERKRKARAADQHLSSEEEDDLEDTLSSEFEDSDEELRAKGGETDVKTEIVKFFQTASVDEMSLISGCSVKKAQKVLELRPFHSWKSLVRKKSSWNDSDSDSDLSGCLLC